MRTTGQALCRKLKFYDKNGNSLGAVPSVIDTGSSLSLINSNTELLKRTSMTPMQDHVEAVGAFGAGPLFIGQVSLYLKVDNGMEKITFLVVDKLNHSMIIGFPDINKLGLSILFTELACQ